MKMRRRVALSNAVAARRAIRRESAKERIAEMNCATAAFPGNFPPTKKRAKRGSESNFERDDISYRVS